MCFDSIVQVLLLILGVRHTNYFSIDVLYSTSVFDETFMLFVDRDRGSDRGWEILHDAFSVPVNRERRR